MAADNENTDKKARNDIPDKANSPNSPDSYDNTDSTRKPSHKTAAIILTVITAVILAAVAIWLVIYNFYGSGSAPGKISVKIPDYTVVATAGYDYVSIEGGQTLYEEEGRPRVPYYIKIVDYPERYRIQSVSLTGTSGIKTETGLNLPVIALNPSSEALPEMKKGKYPLQDFSWSDTINNDGTTTLILKIYPFSYDPESKASAFSNSYKFSVQFIKTDIEILSFTTAEDAYGPGSKASFEIVLENRGGSIDAVLLPSIRKAGSDTVLEYLPQRSLKGLSGTSSVQISWEPGAAGNAGNYFADIAVTDAYGFIHAKASVEFAVIQK